MSGGSNGPATCPGEEVIVKFVAFISGLVAGGFLFLRFGWDDNASLSGWEWYQGAALLGGIGLAGVFPEAHLGAAVGVGIAPFLVESVQTYLHFSRDPTCCGLWPIGLALVLFFGLPAPLIGSGIGRLLMRTSLPLRVYFVPLFSCLAIGALLPNLQNAQRQSLEAETIPGLLRQIFNAERVYSASRPSGIFACDGTLLPGAAGKLGWSHRGGSTMNNYLAVGHYTILLDCPNYISPRSFRVRAFSHDDKDPGASFAIDQTGALTQSGGSGGQANAAERK